MTTLQLYPDWYLILCGAVLVAVVCILAVVTWRHR
jgi:hypothetical protein